VILLPRSVRVYVATAPTNLRKSFEGLSNEVRTLLRADPLSGFVFLFLNRRRSQVKMLMWTRGGFTIVHKRLERGRFAFPAAVTSGRTSWQCCSRDSNSPRILALCGGALRFGLSCHAPSVSPARPRRSTRPVRDCHVPGLRPAQTSRRWRRFKHCVATCDHT
jgi:transposase